MIPFIVKKQTAWNITINCLTELSDAEKINKQSVKDDGDIMSNILNIRESNECRWDELSLGEVMLRLDPGAGRIRSTRTFQVWEGGGEYNVARALRKCFGLNTAVVTAIPESEPGFLLEDLIMQGGVDMSHCKWLPYDGLGITNRQGLNFTERGFGIRGAKGVSDRGHTAVQSLKPGDINWNKIFEEEGVRWFHCGGIFCGLSASTAEVALEAIKAARKAGAVVSYDLNYRPSLWKSRGGQKEAVRVNKEIASYVDVMLGNEEDFTACLGFEVEKTGGDYNSLNLNAYESMIKNVTDEYPNIKVIATTLREVHSASSNDWSAVMSCGGTFYKSKSWKGLDIFDRVGGGDSFASGLIYGFLKGLNPQDCLNYGAAHGALAMTTPGDTSMASLAEVKKLAEGGSARIDR